MLAEADLDGVDLTGTGVDASHEPPVEDVPEESVEPVQSKPVVDYTRDGARVGERYARADVTDIAKDVRGEVKRMRAAGEVPASWKVRVTTDRFAGGQAVNVSIDGVETEPFYIPAYDDWGQRPTAKDALVIGAIEDRMESHNCEDSQTRSIHFYGRLSVNDRSGGWVRDVCERCVAYRPCSC